MSRGWRGKCRVELANRSPVDVQHVLIDADPDESTSKIDLDELKICNAMFNPLSSKIIRDGG